MAITSSTSTARDERSCDGCPAELSRREFLRDAALAAAASLIALGSSAEQAFARPIGFVWPIAASGDTVTYAIPKDDGATIDHDHKVILVRWQQKLYALSMKIG